MAEYDSNFINKNSRAIEWMINSGADFMSNMFDVLLLVLDTSGVFTDLFARLYDSAGALWGKTVPPFMGDAGMFMIRNSSIQVPQPKSETYEEAVTGMKITKIKAKVAFDPKSELKILMDEPLYMMTIFNLFARNNEVTPSFNVLPTLNAPFIFNFLSTINTRQKKFQIDLIVKHQSLLRSEVKDRLRKGTTLQKFNGQLPPERMPYWRFENVKFLGMSNNIVFDRDAANTFEGIFPFHFKRVYKVDRYDGAIGLDENKYTKSQAENAWYYGN